jgi:hypothetical protein
MTELGGPADRAAALLISGEALARLAVAWEACQLSEAARSVVAADDPVALAAGVIESAQRFTRAVSELAEQQGTTWKPPTEAADTWWRANLRDHAEETARDLDDWVLRHQDGEHTGPAPVSARLHLRP